MYTNLEGQNFFVEMPTKNDVFFTAVNSKINKNPFWWASQTHFWPLLFRQIFSTCYKPLNNVYQNIVTPNIADKNGRLEIDFGAIILTIGLPQQVSFFQLLDTKHYFVFVFSDQKNLFLFLLMAGNSVKRTLLQFCCLACCLARNILTNLSYGLYLLCLPPNLIKKCQKSYGNLATLFL